MTQANLTQVKETELFFRQWLRSPKSMGSIIPSSRALARAVADQVVWKPGQVVVELGTGAISQALTDSGLPPEAMMMIELDRSLFEYLRERFPQMRVVNGDATRLVDILRQQGVEEVGTVISGLPMVNMPLAFQRAIVDQGLAAIAPGGRMLQYSYSPIAPIPAKKLGVDVKLVKFVLRNLPPATVWRYRRGGGAGGGRRPRPRAPTR